MKRYTEEEINFIIQGFNNRTLPQSKWDHNAHIIIAFWYNTNYTFDEALPLVKEQIKTYNVAVGTPNTAHSGYHETLTIFWMIFTKNYLFDNPREELIRVLNQFLELYPNKNTPFKFYNRESLFSTKARKNWFNGNLKRISLKKDLTNSHYRFSDEEFKEVFESCNLDPSLFSHEAHLRLAWIIVRENGAQEAIDIICDQIQAYVIKLGAEDKFNKTLTIAATKAVSHFIQKSHSDNFPDFILEFPRLKNNFKDLMAAHYSFDIYNSQNAKNHFLEPDLLPF